jgi:hypothetical protein
MPVPSHPPPGYLGSGGSGGMTLPAAGLPWSAYGGGAGSEMRSSGTWPLYPSGSMPMG